MGVVFLKDRGIKEDTANPKTLHPLATALQCNGVGRTGLFAW
jgi:hypothetical protein